MLLRIQTVRVELRHLRARTAIASAAGSQREQRLQIAENMARKISKEQVAWADPLAALIWGGIAGSRGDKASAMTYLSQAVEGFELADMALYGAASRRRLGEAIAEERGVQLITEADSWMAAQRIKNPERMMQMLAPGFHNQE